MPWTFKNLLDGRNENVIKAWLSSLPPKAKAKINARLRHLAVAQQWPRHWVKKIHGYEYIYELRVVLFGIQYRPLGCYGPRKDEFTFVIGAIEQGDRITPPDAFRIAVARCADVLSERSAVCDHSYE
jgi:hypothetical protein